MAFNPNPNYNYTPPSYNNNMYGSSSGIPTLTTTQLQGLTSLNISSLNHLTINPFSSSNDDENHIKFLFSKETFRYSSCLLPSEVCWVKENKPDLYFTMLRNKAYIKIDIKDSDAKDFNMFVESCHKMSGCWFIEITNRNSFINCYEFIIYAEIKEDLMLLRLGQE